VTNSGRAALGIRATTVITQAGQDAGVGIVSVEAGSGAAKAGLKPGYVITSVDGRPTPSSTDLNTILATLKPGEQVPVQYVNPDDGSTKTVTVTLGDLTS
jgi:S1-C subfamily serine protease